MPTKNSTDFSPLSDRVGALNWPAGICTVLVGIGAQDQRDVERIGDDVEILPRTLRFSANWVVVVPESMMMRLVVADQRRRGRADAQLRSMFCHMLQRHRLHLLRHRA